MTSITRLADLAAITKTDLTNALGVTVFAVTADGTYGNFAPVARLTSGGQHIDALTAHDIAVTAEWLARTKFNNISVDDLLWGISCEEMGNRLGFATVEVYRADILARAGGQYADLFRDRLADLKERHEILFRDEFGFTAQTNDEDDD